MNESAVKKQRAYVLGDKGYNMSSSIEGPTRGARVDTLE